eukprot:GEMP01065276.1.p1 GENE.GEMP01065276.1~~GEMP01065276.1.p1  ORF type:complete len:105 (-),score=3.74 GEMP01065276.1:241-555(-)
MNDCVSWVNITPLLFISLGALKSYRNALRLSFMSCSRTWAGIAFCRKYAPPLDDTGVINFAESRTAGSGCGAHQFPVKSPRKSYFFLPYFVVAPRSAYRYGYRL